jgi:hypothetical protein
VILSKILQALASGCPGLSNIHGRAKAPHALKGQALGEVIADRGTYKI